DAFPRHIQPVACHAVDGGDVGDLGGSGVEVGVVKLGDAHHLHHVAVDPLPVDKCDCGTVHIDGQAGLLVVAVRVADVGCCATTLRGDVDGVLVCGVGAGEQVSILGERVNRA